MPSAVVRLLCESRSPSRTVRDASTELRPFYWRGSSVKFQFALTDSGAFLLAADIGEIIVEVKALTALALDDSLMRKTYVAADCDETFTPAPWSGGTGQLLEAAFTVNEAAILPGTYRLIVRHVAGDGEENVYLSSELQVLDPQSGSEGIDPPPIAWTYLDDVPVVRYTAQALSAPQRAQAWQNLSIATSTGGNAGADNGKFVVYLGTGWLRCSSTLHVEHPNHLDGIFVNVNPDKRIVAANGTFFSNLIWDAFDDHRNLRVPNRSGTLAVLMDLTATDQRGGVAIDGASTLHVVGWNADQDKWQGIGIKGAAGAEQLFVYNLP